MRHYDISFLQSNWASSATAAACSTGFIARLLLLFQLTLFSVVPTFLGRFHHQRHLNFLQIMLIVMGQGLKTYLNKLALGLNPFKKVVFAIFATKAPLFTNCTLNFWLIVIIYGSAERCFSSAFPPQFFVFFKDGRPRPIDYGCFK